MSKQPTIGELRAALDASRVPPKDYFARLVQRGIVNAHGQVTKLFGGAAEPEGHIHSVPSDRRGDVTSR